MVQKDFPNEPKKGSPSNKYPQATTGGSAARIPPQPSHPPTHPFYGYGPAAPPPPPPPPPPGYDHLPPADRGPPGPYTTAQYDSRKPGMPIPHYHAAPPISGRSAAGSPQSHVNHGREPPPPHSHYPPPRLGPPPPPDHPRSPHPTGYPSYRDDHRTPHWPPPGHPADAYSGPPPPPPRYFDSSKPYSSGGPPPPPKPPPPAQSYPPQHSVDHVHPQPGPYRFSDPTLRREAVSRLSNSERFNDVDGREGATSPSQIESSHREEVTTMGCTCKKTKCLKLYCQCFAAKIYCGANCRCLVCQNTVNFEKERKDAIRSILSRNPAAFDTKFKKNPNSVDNKTVPGRVLAHKLGCKCRKSACMKKYCECYAGNVKCGPSCRCVGCKNLPRGGLGPPGVPPAGSFFTRESTSSNSSSDDDASTGKKREPWMMNAAHNLAFLKHASPAADRSRRSQPLDNGEAGSMPSLASEESPGDKRAEPDRSVSAVGASSIPQPASSEKTAVNALLMAAMAMTEMSNPDNGQNDVSRQTTTTTPEKFQKNKVKKSPDSTPFQTPQKKRLGSFASPKRKLSNNSSPPERQGTVKEDVVGPMSRNDSSESPDGASDEDSPKRDLPFSDTPSNQQKVKRSRLGSVRKEVRNLSSELVRETKPRMNIYNLSTPNTKGDRTTEELTPVSARCIDFRKMHVNESPSIHETKTS